jgi:hypothetical protein
MIHKLLLEIEIEENITKEEVVQLFKNLFEDSYEIDGLDVAVNEITYLEV